MVKMTVISSEGVNYIIDKYLEEIQLTLDTYGYGKEDYRGYLLVMNNLIYFVYQKYTDSFELDYHILEDWIIKN